MIVELDEQLFVPDHFLLPGGFVEMLQLVELLLREVEAVPMDVLVARHPADGRFAAQRAAVGAIDDPLQHAHVLADSRATGTCRRHPCGTSSRGRSAASRSELRAILIQWRK